MRLDKWLWQARFFKTRSLASKLVAAGHVRVNGERVSKPASSVRPEDVLTFAQGRAIRVIKVLGLPARRGPAPEAQEHYEDLSPPPPGPPPPRVGPRPTKKARREIDAAREGGMGDGDLD